MKPQWIDCSESAIFIGPFWMGSAQEMQKTQEAIDEECALYDEATHEQEDENTSTEIGEIHYDRQ